MGAEKEKVLRNSRIFFSTNLQSQGQLLRMASALLNAFTKGNGCLGFTLKEGLTAAHSTRQHYITGAQGTLNGGFGEGEVTLNTLH